jgi:hypothetical protein
VAPLFLARWISGGRFEKDFPDAYSIPFVQSSAWYRVRVPVRTVTMVGPG